jgi:hypothetical protein
MAFGSCEVVEGFFREEDTPPAFFAWVVRQFNAIIVVAMVSVNLTNIH